MSQQRMSTTPGAAGLLAAVLLAAGCSGPGEDVRVTFCKNMTGALHGDAASIEWKDNQNSFHRPEYAVTALTYEVETADGRRRAGRSACHYAYEALEDTAVTLADPLSAYATLPFAMSIDGRMLSNAELLAARTAEQRRQGQAVIDALDQGARDLADKIRAGVSR